jgi:hypothetical protein
MATRPGGTTAEDAGAWQASVQKIVQLQQLEDDWDGLGAIAPVPELVESAVGLAYLLSAKGVEPSQEPTARSTLAGKTPAAATLKSKSCGRFLLR